MLRTADEDVAAFGIVRMLAGRPAEGYISECLLGPLGRFIQSPPTLEGVSQTMGDPEKCLRGLFGHYAFCRRGKERAELATSALKAIEAVRRNGSLDVFLCAKTAEPIWQAFSRIMEDKGRDPQEQLNRGVIQGLAEVAQESFREKGKSVFDSISGYASRSTHLESCFSRFVEIRGVGPKVCSVILRDAVFLAGIEGKISNADRIFVQPVDKWLRAIAPYLSSEFNDGSTPDWVLAGKLARFARLAGVSGIRFNMGTTFFCSRMAVSAEALDREMRSIDQHAEAVLQAPRV